jgi:hypothetical protein
MWNNRTVRGRWFVVALALVAATAFLISVQMGRWWSVGDVEIGPFSSKQCFGGECRPASLTWTGGTLRWQRAGMGTWAGGMISAFALVCIAAGLASRRMPRLFAKMAMVSIVTTLLVGVLFIAQYPDTAGASPDRGLVIFVAAIVLGAIAAVYVIRRAPLTAATAHSRPAN